ncbi:MAG TPA: hypothetical protein VK601_05950 [Kofleriaceae bacterium]|nr:hypothetical protein [Kofleriaceae bacterium]
MDNAPSAPDKPGPADDTSKLGRFIMRYHTFLSSFVIGVAGLIATSIWQYRQSETTAHQAEAQQKVAETTAENSWKITRADILSKNLSVLASTGPDTAGQRYGVLLSLTRAEILDPELAVSYALELGKDNADDMTSVLVSTHHKDYARLARAFALSCEEKYGVAPAVPVCEDKLAARSTAIGKLFSADIQLALKGGEPGPMALLDREREVQVEVQQYAGLFEIALTELYEHREWDEVTRFAGRSPGAHLISALVLAAARTGEFVTDDEAKQLDAFHDEQTRWLTGYFAGKTCDSECKGRLIEVMVTHYQEAQGDFDAALRALLVSPRAVSGGAISRLHARLLWCQVDDTDLFLLRDKALIPAAEQVLASPQIDPAIREAVISLLALVAAPSQSDPAAAMAWSVLQGHIAKAGPRVVGLLRDRRDAAARQRGAPPPALRALDFCSAPEVPDGAAP